MARRFLLFGLIAFFSVFWLAVEFDARATPEAHILRIDPRTGLKDGRPLLTTVVEVVQFKRLSEALQPCAGKSPGATLSCWSEHLEKPGALWEPFPFPEQNARLLVKVSGEDHLTRFADKTQWGKAQQQAHVGTAWLVAIDSAASMGGRFGDARAIAHEFIEEMQPNDLMDLMFFDDVQTVRDTKWKAFKQRAELGNVLNEFKSTSPSHGRDRALFSEIRGMTQDAFGSLGNSDQPEVVPLHQAMVVLSNGAGRGDPESASPSAEVFHQYLDRGRFPEDNTSLPKTPLPVISIWLPNAAGLVESVYRNNEAQFMQALANPEIGGFFDIVQEGSGASKAKTIIGLARARFNAMWLIHWTMSCVNPSVEQSFNLVFENTHPMIAPDGTFRDVPIGMDPSQWPLDIDVERTVKAAQGSPLYPGGQFTVYGDFCWSGDKQRAEAYFVPTGTRPTSDLAGSRDPEVAKKALQQIQSEHMLGTALAAGDGYATLSVPDDEKVLDGLAENLVAHVVLYDNRAHRASALDSKGVLTLRAIKKPLSLTLVAGIAGLLIVIVLLVMVLVRSGGAGRRRGRGIPLAPLSPAYGTPAAAFPGAPPEGYRMQPLAADPLAATAAVGGGLTPPALFAMGVPARVTPPASASREPRAGVTPPIVTVACPACGMNTMVAPGQPSVCFSCGQPIAAPAVSFGMATIRGAAGQFAVREGFEFRVGRDPAQCPIFLSEPRVSGVHATLKFEAGQLMVRDEGSNNGTWVSGARLSPGVWASVPMGQSLRFGPVEFTVQAEV